MIPGQEQHLDTELKLLCQDILEIVRDLVDDDERGKGTLEYEPLENVIEVSKPVTFRVRFALRSQVRGGIQCIQKNPLYSNLVRLERQ
jgi:hypothetical protein